MKRIDVAIAVVMRGDTVLVCQRKAGDTLGGYWEFPGGKVEAGESLQACVVRELREELDIAVLPGAELEPIQYEYPHAHVTLHPLLCDHLEGEPKLLECQCARWARAGELPSLQFPPANQSLLKEVARRLNAGLRSAAQPSTRA